VPLQKPEGDMAKPPPCTLTNKTTSQNKLALLLCHLSQVSYHMIKRYKRSFLTKV
jgi:hypothetical protein